jgi:hypothetical protein
MTAEGKSTMVANESLIYRALSSILHGLRTRFRRKFKNLPSLNEISPLRRVTELIQTL